MRFSKSAVRAVDLPPLGDGASDWRDVLARAPSPQFRTIDAWPAQTREVKFAPFHTTKGAPRWHFLHHRLAEGRDFLRGEGRDILWSRHARAVAAPAGRTGGGGLIAEFNLGGGPGVPEGLLAMDYNAEPDGFSIADRRVSRIAGLTVPFAHFGGETFGHTVLDGLLQVWLWRDVLQSGEARLGLWSTPSWLGPVLDRCGVKQRAELTGDVALLKRAGLSSALAAQGVYFPGDYSRAFFDWLRAVYGVETPPVGPRRLYIRRASTYGRAVRNSDAVEDMVARYGFTPVSPETLTFEAQVRLFAGAEVVLSPWGSGLTLSPLLHGARRVFEMVPSAVTDVWFVRQAMVHGFDYTPILQVSDDDGSFDADLARIEKVLRHALRDEAAA